MKIKLLHILSLLLVLLPLVILTHVFWKYAVNIPHWDDHAFKGFQINYNKAGSIFEKLRLIFAQHNEHRIALTRIFSLLIYKIKGTIDYKWLMVLGNISLLGVFGLLYLVFKKYQLLLIYFVPVSFLLFGLQLHENLFWGMASVQNFWVVFWAVLTFYLLLISENKYAFWGAIFSNFWAINTSGNGILVPIIGLLILLYQWQKKEFIYWLSSSCVFIFLYFFHYQSSPDASATHANLSDWPGFLKGIFIYFGSLIDSVAIYPQKRETIAFIVGLVMGLFALFYLGQIILKKYNRAATRKVSNNELIELFWMACLLFISGTALVVTYSRLGYGLIVLFGSKYKIYSTLFFIIFYLVSLNLFKGKSQKIFVGLAITTTFLFNAYSYFADYQSVIYTRHERTTDQFNWTYSLLSDEKRSNSQNSTTVFVADKEFYDDLPVLFSKENEVATSPYTIDSISQTPTDIYLWNKQTKAPTYGNADNGYYIILKSSTKIYIFPTKFNLNTGKKNFLMTFNYFDKGFISQLSKYSIETGSYQISLLKVDNRSTNVYSSGQVIDIQGIKSAEIKKNW